MVTNHVLFKNNNWHNEQTNLNCNIFQLILDAQISFIWFILLFHVCNQIQPNKFFNSWGHDKKYIVVHLLTITC